MIDIYENKDKRSRLCRCCGDTFKGSMMITMHLDWRTEQSVCKSCMPVLIHELQRVADGGEQRECPDDLLDWHDEGDRRYKEDNVELDSAFLGNMREHNESKRRQE